jgi:hypothetical protein
MKKEVLTLTTAELLIAARFISDGQKQARH